MSRPSVAGAFAANSLLSEHAKLGARQSVQVVDRCIRIPMVKHERPSVAVASRRERFLFVRAERPYGVATGRSVGRRVRAPCGLTCYFAQRYALGAAQPAPLLVIYGDGQARRAAYEARASRSRRNHFQHNIGGRGADAGGGNSNGGTAAGGGSGASRCA